MLQSSRRKRRAQQKLEPEGAPLPSKRPSVRGIRRQASTMATKPTKRMRENDDADELKAANAQLLELNAPPSKSVLRWLNLSWPTVR